MPIYEYTCKACHKSFEHLARSMSAAAAGPVKCPECGSVKTARALSVFAVKGDGGKSSGSTESGGGHVHSGMCGCGKRRGSCGG